MPRSESRIKGAFEVFDPGDGQPKVVEPLVVISYQNRLFQPGDTLPAFGVDLYYPPTGRTRVGTANPSKINVLSFVNQFGTPDCDIQTASIELLAQQNPDVAVTSITRQKTAALKRVSEQGISHRLASIGEVGAKMLSVQLAPDQDKEGKDLADKFWYEALCRTVMLVGSNYSLLHIEQLMDQAKQPNLEAIQLKINEVRSLK